MKKNYIVKFIFVFLLFSIVFLSGCFSYDSTDVKGSIVKIQGNEEKDTYLYFGVGIIQINRNNNDIRVIDASSLGLSLKNTALGKGFDFGYDSHTTTLINKDVNALIEVKKSLLNGLEIKINKGEIENEELD